MANRTGHARSKRAQSHRVKGQAAFTRLFLVLVTLLFLTNLIYSGGVALQNAIANADEKVVGSQSTGKAKDDNQASASLLQQFNNSLAFTNSFRSTYNRIQRISGGNYAFGNVAKDIYRDKHGRLTYVCDHLDMENHAKALATFSAKLEKSGIPMLYLQAPHKILKGENDLLYRITDYSNDNADRLLNSLNQQGVDTFDLREVLKEADRTISPIFFNTDSRWQISTALDAYLYTLPLLNGRYQLGQEGLTLFGSAENFAVNRTDNCFLGNQGVAIGQSIIDALDGFDRIVPYARTEFTVEITHTDGQVVQRSGDFENALLTKKTDKTDLYESYLGDLAPLTRITNQNTTSTSRLLIISDELAPPYAAFCSLDFAHTTLVVPSLYNGSILKLIAKEKPDLVVVLYQPKSFENDVFFQLS